MKIRRLGVLATILLVVAGCTSAGAAGDQTADGDGGELQATRWVLESYSSNGSLTIVPEGLYADADFRSGRVKGFAGCNDYDAVYRNAGRMLLVSVPDHHADGLPGTDLLVRVHLPRTASSRAGSTTSSANTLVIRGPDLAILLVFRAAPAQPAPRVVGRRFVRERAEYAVTPLPDSNMTAVFGLSRVAGFSGCNTYTGPYTTNGVGRGDRSAGDDATRPAQRT